MAIEEPSQDPMRDVTPLLIEVQSNLDQELSLESLARRFDNDAPETTRSWLAWVGFRGPA